MIRVHLDVAWFTRSDIVSLIQDDTLKFGLEPAIKSMMSALHALILKAK